MASRVGTIRENWSLHSVHRSPAKCKMRNALHRFLRDALHCGCLDTGTDTDTLRAGCLGLFAPMHLPQSVSRIASVTGKSSTPLIGRQSVNRSCTAYRPGRAQVLSLSRHNVKLRRRGLDLKMCSCSAASGEIEVDLTALLDRSRFAATPKAKPVRCVGHWGVCCSGTDSKRGRRGSKQ